MGIGQVAMVNLLEDFVGIDFLLGKLGKRHEELIQLVLRDESCFAMASREMFRGKSSESTTHLTEFNRFGMNWSRSSKMKTRRTCSLVQVW